MSNAQRAAVIALAQSAFPVLVLFGIGLTDAQIAGIMLVITNAITLLALIFPAKDTATEPTPAFNAMPSNNQTFSAQTVTVSLEPNDLLARAQPIALPGMRRGGN